MVLCRKIARILKIDAPRLAAEVRKPARSECAEKSVSLKPELPDVRLHDQAHGLMVQPIQFDNAVALMGCPDRRVDRLCITCCPPFQPSHHAGCRRDLGHAASATGSL